MSRVLHVGSRIPTIAAQIDWSHPLAQSLRAVMSGGVVWWWNGSRTQVGLPGVHRVTAAIAAPGPLWTHRNSGTIAVVLGWPPPAITAPAIGRWTTDGGYLSIHEQAEATPARVFAGHAAGGVADRFNPSNAHIAMAHPSMVALTHDNANSPHLRLYGPSGVLSQTIVQASAPTGTPTDATYLGASPTNYLDVRSLHVYNRALTGHEIAWLHDEPYAMLIEQVRRKHYHAAAPPPPPPVGEARAHARLSTGLCATIPNGRPKR